MVQTGRHALGPERIRLYSNQKVQLSIFGLTGHLISASPLVGNSASSSLISTLICNLLVDSLTEFSYEAELAGLRYSFSSNADGLQLSVAGYDDKIPALLYTLLEKLKHFEVDASRFSVKHHQLVLKLRNQQLESPYLMGDQWLKYLLKTGEWTREELLDAMPGK